MMQCLMMAQNNAQSWCNVMLTVMVMLMMIMMMMMMVVMMIMLMMMMIFLPLGSEIGRPCLEARGRQ